MAYKSTNLLVRDIQPVGAAGDILRKIEETKAKLLAERVKNQLSPPRFPRLIGLITGNDAKAKSDVVEGAQTGRSSRARARSASATSYTSGSPADTSAQPWTT